MRRALLTLHLWAGLAAAAFLIVIGVTGAALVFEDDIDRGLNPSLSFVVPAGEPLPLSALAASANEANPSDRVTAVRIPDARNQAYEFFAPARRSVMVDPYSGAVLGTRDRERSVARRLHLAHTRLLAGEYGERLVGLASILLLGLAASGLVLWWPRRILAVRTASSSWRRANFDLHNAIGFYSSAVILVIAASGILIAFERTLDPLVLTLNGSAEPDIARLKSAPASGPHITPEQAIAAAAAAMPGAFASNINLPTARDAVYRILLKFPEDRTPAGRSRAYVDQFNGRVLAVENTRAAPAGRRILNLKRSLHTGDVFGAPGRALYFLVSLAVAVQACTGVLMWWNRRKPGRRAAIRAAVVLVAALAAARAAGAQDLFEIQVYPYEVVEPHHTMIEFHTNFIPSGTHDTEGGLYPNHHQFHETIEITHGWTTGFETGFYIETAYVPDVGEKFTGWHIRPRFRFPESTRFPFKVSLSFEYAFNEPGFDPNRQTLEIRPIFERQQGRLYLSINPDMSLATKGPDAGDAPGFEPNAKVGWDFTPKVSGGIEYYSETGTVKHYEPLSQQHHILVPVVDLNFGPDWEFNAGVGRGLTGTSEHWILKMIVGRRFKL